MLDNPAKTTQFSHRGLPYPPKNNPTFLLRLDGFWSIFFPLAANAKPNKNDTMKKLDLSQIKNPKLVNMYEITGTLTTIRDGCGCASHYIPPWVDMQAKDDGWIIVGHKQYCNVKCKEKSERKSAGFNIN